jgi:hypothetical protein
MLDIAPLRPATLVDPKPAIEFIPHKLLDHLRAHFSLKNDAALCRSLGAQPPHICKVRRGVLPVSSHLILLIHEKTGMPVSRIRALVDEQAKIDAAVDTL